MSRVGTFVGNFRKVVNVIAIKGIDQEIIVIEKEGKSLEKTTVNELKVFADRGNNYDCNANY